MVVAEAEAAALDPTKGSLVSAKVLELQGEAAGVHSTLASAHSVTSGTHVPAMLFTSGIFSAPSLPQDQQQLLHGWDPPTGVEEIDGVHGGGIDASAPSSGRQQSVSDRAQLWDDYGERAYCPFVCTFGGPNWVVCVVVVVVVVVGRRQARCAARLQFARR